MEIGGIGRPTFGGIASGLDTNALLEGLLDIERIPLQRLESRRAEISSQRGLVRQLNTKLVALREAAQKLDNRNRDGDGPTLGEEFLRYKGSSTDEDVVTVSAGAGAAPGEIAVRVFALAAPSRRFSSAFGDPSETALAAGQSMRIALDNGDPDAVPPVEPTEIEIQAGAGPISLEDLRDQINTSADNNGAVRADLLRISDDETRLVLTSTNPGEANRLEVSGDFGFEPGDTGAFADPVRNAEFEVFGQRLERPDNVVDDVLTGLSLRLVGVSTPPEGETEARAETVNVEIDVDEVASALEAFTSAYNDVMGFINSQFDYDETRKTAGPLSGDFTLRRVQSQLRDIVSSPYAFADSPGNPFASGNTGGSISGIGLEIEGGGTLKLDREKLEEALGQDALSVREFLGGRSRETAPPGAPDDFYDEGFAQRFVLELEELVRSGDGTLAKRDDAFERRIRDFDDSISSFERRLSRREETLIARFTELERLVAGLQTQQGFLSGLG